MTSRERVFASLNFERIDKVPRTIIWAEEWLEEKVAPASLLDFFSFDIDVLRLETTSTRQYTRELKELAERIRLGDTSQLKTYAEWGYIPGAMEVHPLDQAETLNEMADFEMPQRFDPSKVGDLKKKIHRLKAKEVATLVEPPHLGGEIFETAWRLRGFENLMRDLILNPGLCHFLFTRLAHRALPYVEEIAAAGADMLLLDDDVGSPSGMLISPEQWRVFLKPHLARLVKAAKRKAPQIKVLYHSDGNFDPIVSELAEIGVDAIHPVQPDVMDPIAVREKYGRRISIVGGFAAQTTFSFQDAESIRREARDLARKLGSEGGVILAPAYDLEEDVPLESIKAFFDGVDEVSF